MEAQGRPGIYSRRNGADKTTAWTRGPHRVNAVRNGCLFLVGAVKSLMRGSRLWAVAFVRCSLQGSSAVTEMPFGVVNARELFHLELFEAAFNEINSIGISL